MVARHDRLTGKQQVSFDWQHYIPLIGRKPGALRNGAPFTDMPLPLLRLRQGLLKRPGGDERDITERRDPAEAGFDGAFS